ncbi:hypothetical protein WM24_15640 [Burkholderia ubonensis]|uniref:hypothetical protein n=1 Tax=Burkholderia ubonensis TaxID=101571 RepID=UPI00075617C5|nr:hypothetical protein [Burkholderia ubonensis]KWN85837.1 hypothetical protein WM24_15640 [Burkholderia ubonensis]
MTLPDKYIWSRALKIIVAIFVMIFIGVVIYLFYPIVRCMREWGEFAADCREALELTLFIPVPLFLFVWGVSLATAILVMRKRQ